MANVVITGANRGIGLELTRRFKSRGDHVYAVCRNTNEYLEELEVTVIRGIDVADRASGSVLAELLHDVDIDILINNAGVLFRGGLDELDEDQICQQFRVNSLAPLRMTQALRGRIVQGGKVIIITSRMGSIQDNDSGGSYGYRMSKAAVNAAGKSLSIDLRQKKIAVALLHPGWVRTEMTGKTGLLDASESAVGLVARIDALTLEETGGFWHQNGDRLPW